MSAPEDLLAFQLKAAKIPFFREVRVCKERKFRLDFVIDRTGHGGPLLAVEVQGSLWVKGGHNTGTGLQRDFDKGYYALLNGYKLLYVSPADIKSLKALARIQVLISDIKELRAIR